MELFYPTARTFAAKHCNHSENNGVSKYVRTLFRSRLIKAEHVTVPFQYGSWSNRRIAAIPVIIRIWRRPPILAVQHGAQSVLGGATIIEGAVGSCHVLKPVITHAFTARITPFWQVASHSK